jgi:hypothetical protein
MAYGLVLAVCCVLLGGCGDAVEGTYTDSESAVTIELRGDGKAFVSLGTLGTNAGEWERDGDRVILNVGGESSVLTINDDGSLDGGMMLGTLKKK